MALCNAQNMVFMRYFLNLWIDFDQTCIDSFLAGGKEFIRF